MGGASACRDTRGIIRVLQERFRPKGVAAQQAKVARAQALAFVAPVWFVGFPAILKVSFHAIHGVDDATRRGYLEQAQRLGREF